MHQVFLAHNSKDKPAVRELKQALWQRGISAWYDEAELRPGISWLKLLEEGITSSDSVAVLVGPHGPGPWEVEEMEAALILAVDDKSRTKRPVIPVLLPGAKSKPKLPLLLRGRTWVDLRGGLKDERLRLLIWGITGIKPEEIIMSSAILSPHCPRSLTLPKTSFNLFVVF